MSCKTVAKFLLFFAAPALAQVRVENADAIRAQVGAGAYSGLDLSQVKIAVLDNGFAGFAPGRALLPGTAELIEGPVNPQAATNHGLGMAQIAWAVAGRPAQGPQFFLVNANGYSNLKAAVDFVVGRKIDIVLYAQVWSFGGNFDGTGFINRQVDRAVDAGAVWVNAAGNTRNEVYNGPVSVTDAQGSVRLPGPGNSLRIENRLDSNPVTVTLSWNDFTDSDANKTSKDLDLFLYDRNGQVVAKADKIQRGEAPGENTPELSAYARETFTLNLDRGQYQLKIVARSQNFGAGDRLRVHVDPERPGSVEFLDRSRGSEVMVPADHPRVLTVGDCDGASATGPTLDGRSKPDVVIADSRVNFTDGNRTLGTSNAAAIVAGSLALLKAKNSALDRAGVTKWATDLRTKAPSCSGAPHWRLPGPNER
jgi:hypothetical protein